MMDLKLEKFWSYSQDQVNSFLKRKNIEIFHINGYAAGSTTYLDIFYKEIHDEDIQR